MRNDVTKRTIRSQKRRDRKSLWWKIIAGLAAVMVFSMTYAVASQDATTEGVCQLPEHTHSEACYTQVEGEPHRKLACTMEGASCDLIVHRHTGSCYDENGEQWCRLAVVEEHSHGEECYAQPDLSAVHQHTDACYAWEQAENVGTDDGASSEMVRGDLICTESTQPPEPELTCVKEEVILHEHGASCYDENGRLTCGQKEILKHQHSDVCFKMVSETVKMLTCGMEEHTHTEECHVAEPTAEPSTEPTEQPTTEPTAELTVEPTVEPTVGPTEQPTAELTAEPTAEPTTEPTVEPTEEPTTEPAVEPTEEPTEQPTTEPTVEPTEEPTTEPAVEPTEKPTEQPTTEPTVEPTEQPTTELTAAPTTEPTAEPTEEPTEQPMAETTIESTAAPAAELIATLTDVTPQETVLHSLTIPADWPVMGSVDASNEPAPMIMLFALEAGEGESGGTATANPLTMENYVTDVTLFYRTKDDGIWMPVTDSTTLTGKESLHLKISYGKKNDIASDKNVKIADLEAAGYTIVYDLPNIMRNPSVQGKITSGGKDVGMITADGKTVTLKFNPTWVDEQKTAGGTVIHGDFYVESKIDITEVQGGGNKELVFGDVKIEVDFDPEIVAKSARIDTAKSVPAFVSDATGDYLIYTLTVTAGVDGAPKVRVEDTFTGHPDWIERYIGVGETESSTSSNTTVDVGPVETGGNGAVMRRADGAMVWNIGDMQPNETRTLTYKVKLLNGYTQTGCTDTITNSATPYSKEHSRNPVKTDFTPTANTTITKQSANFEPNPNGDGGGTITYTVQVQADEENTYVLENVQIMDALDGSVQEQQGTDDKFLPYLSYDANSFQLDGATCSPTIAESGHSFTCNVDSLGPGDSKTLTYTIKVAPGAFVAAGNADIPINNHAALCIGGPSNFLNSCDSARTVEKKMWSRKLVGERQKTNITIEMSGAAYDATGASITPMTNPGSFDVPEGSYQYQIVANEAGDWDISSASMTDRLSGGHMQFVGYVRVDAYTIDGDAPSVSLEDQAAIASLSKRPLAQTVWVRADGQTDFAFKPSEIGLEGKKAYLLTYYAQPVSMDGVTQVVVSNTFTMGDILGHLQTGIEANASVIVHGANSFSAEKRSWYYAPAGTPGSLPKGAIYWVIQVDGNTIPRGTQFEDEAGGTPAHYTWPESVVGLYTGSLGGAAVTDYADIDALQDSGKLQKVDEGRYRVNQKNNTSITVELIDDVVLENGESLYAIVKTEPSNVPTGARETYTYHNTLKSSYNGENWVAYPEAVHVLCGSSGLFKELTNWGTWDGKKWHYEGHTSTWSHEPEITALMDPGLYAVWHVQANYLGNLSGRYRFEDIIPEGLELAYICQHWYGPDYGDEKPYAVEIGGLDAGWIRDETTRDGNRCIYYTKDRKAIWEVDGLKDGHIVDGYGVEYQIVCRVTDPDVLLDHQSKDFTNKATLYNAQGREVSTVTNTGTFQTSTLSKTGDSLTAENGGRYPFRIEVNELGEDLTSGSETITLVDELSASLLLDIESIQVKKKTDEDITDDCKLSVVGQTFRLELPDNIPLIVTYEAVVNAPPGQNHKVDIVNRAYWEGYSYTNDATVNQTDFTYKVGGTAGSGGESPTLKIIKMDQHNAAIKLPGAEFSLQEVGYDAASKTFSPIEGAPKWMGTTSEDGTLIFGTTESEQMTYNTIYCLTEESAPPGYVTDSTPFYFAISNDPDHDFPDGVTVWYQGAQMTHDATNHKGEIEVTKAFKTAGGQNRSPIPGTYTFGLYATPDASGELLQTVDITYKQGETENEKALFINLELNKPYYVFELDKDGEPITQNGVGVTGSGQYLVTYATAAGQSNKAENGQTVTVTNQCFSPELPHTGGTGMSLYILGGLLTMACASALLLGRRKKGW